MYIPHRSHHKETQSIYQIGILYLFICCGPPIKDGFYY